MPDEQESFIRKLIKRLSDEDWIKSLEDEMQTMDLLKVPSNDIFYGNLLKKIKHEIDKLKDE
jgi:hypothetical protein